jgi:hypothetical protein
MCSPRVVNVVPDVVFGVANVDKEQQQAMVNPASIAGFAMFDVCFFSGVVG